MAVMKQPDPLVKEVIIQPGGGVKQETEDTVEQILERRKKVSQQRLEAAEIERMTLEAENDVATLRGEKVPKSDNGKNNTEDDEREKQEAKAAALRKQLIEQGKLLLDSGMPPEQVGRILVGLTPQQYGQQPLYTPGKNGFDFDDFMKMWKLLNEQRETSELKQMIVGLNKRLDETERERDRRERESERGEGRGKSKQEYVDPLDILLNTKDKLLKLGIVQEVGTGKVTGKETAEELKEKNRHEEEMARIGAEREHKERMSNIMSEIPEKIGNGIAGFVKDGGAIFGNDESKSVDKTPPPSDSGLQSFKCDKCGAQIFHAPNAVKMTCAKCGKVYERSEVKDG